MAPCSIGRSRSCNRSQVPVRRGVVLIVIVGVSALLAALVFSLSLKVSRILSSQPEMGKTAQAYLMLQAARVYLSGRWLDSTVAARVYLSAQVEGLYFPQVAAATVAYQWVAAASIYSYGHQLTSSYPIATTTYNGLHDPSTYGLYATKPSKTGLHTLGWFYYKTLNAHQFLVLGAGGPGRPVLKSGYPSAAPAANADYTPTGVVTSALPLSQFQESTMANRDVRVYAVYDSYTDDFTETGYYPGASWPSPLPYSWLGLPAAPAY